MAEMIQRDTMPVQAGEPYVTDEMVEEAHGLHARAALCHWFQGQRGIPLPGMLPRQGIPAAVYEQWVRGGMPARSDEDWWGPRRTPNKMSSWSSDSMSTPLDL